MIPQKTLEELLKRVEKPGRYIGHEKNCVYKNIVSCPNSNASCPKKTTPPFTAILPLPNKPAMND